MTYVWIALLALIVPAGAVDPDTRTFGGYQDLAGGSGHGIAVTADGSLVRAAAPVALTDTESDRIWDLHVQGNALWIATGDDGGLFRFERGKPARRVFDSPEISLHALASAGDGAVFVGSSPDGLVYRVRADGQVRTVAQTEARYVWDLQRDGDGLLLATGAPARVQRLDGDELTTWFAATGSQHVRALAGNGRRWFAGTAGSDSDGAARLYEVDANGGRLLLETSYEEITHLLAHGDTLFAAVTEAGDADDASAALLRVEPSGASWTVWRGRGVIAGLLGPIDNHITVVLRQPGRVLQVHAHGRVAARLAAIDSSTANAVVRWGDDIIIGDGQSGRLQQLTEAAGDSGWFNLPVYDLGGPGTWGVIGWEQSAPRGSEVVVRTRSGNSAEPDEGWSDWSAALTSGTGIPSPGARYLQIRAVLHGDDASVRRLSASGRQTNLPPRIEDVTTFAYRGNPQAPGPPPPQPANGSGNSPALPQSKTLRLVRWQASDGNGDALRFDIYLRGEGQSQWKLVEQDIETSTVFWDTEPMPEGLTRLRLVASDKSANADPLQHEWITEPFAIDNSPPVVELRTRRTKQGIWLEASLVDRVTAVRGASYSIDYADNGPRLAAEDGLFDTPQESVRHLIRNLEPGEHIITVRAWDELDNVGAAQAVIVVD